MALRKKISKIFKNNVGANNTAPRDDRPATPIALPTITEDDEPDIIAATQASFQTEISRLEEHIQDQTQQLSKQEHETRLADQENNNLKHQLVSKNAEHASLQTRVESAESRLNELHTAHAIEVSFLQADLQKVLNQLAAELEEKSRLRRETTALENDCRALYNHHQQNEVLAAQHRASLAEREKEVRDLERRLSLALQPMDTDSRRAYEEGSTWVREKVELEARFNNERIFTSQQIRTLNGHLQRKEEDCRALETRVSAIEAELQEEKSQHQDAKGIIQALQDNQESMQEDFGEIERQLIQLRSLFGPGPTPRQVLFLMLFTTKFPHIRQEDNTDSDFARSHRLENLRAEDLNVSLTEQAFATFAKSTSPGSPGYNAVQRIQFIRCSECKRHKINNSRNNRNHNLTEFPRWFRQTHCRSSPICKDCLKQRLKESVMQDWWYGLGCERWLKCPISKCGHALEIHRAEDLGEMLRDFADIDVALLKAMYCHSLAFREALVRIEPQPSQEAISASIGLHQQLNAFGLFADNFNVLFADEYNEAEPFNAGEVLIGNLDRDNLKIPIFTKFFRRSEIYKECSICVESLYEIDVESEEQWRNILCCNHDIDFCKECLARHLEFQLNQHGQNARGRLTCPTCNRVLSESEIRNFSSAETAEKYDKYLLLSHLSSDPNFRRCLQAGCENGQIYEQDEYPNPHITCSLCDFEMCFTHQIPWHTGLSCGQYDSQQQHGDPEYQQTREWMQSNSKNCPGTNCGVNIEKGNACFHMTCTQCRHEFCWECLADWSRINPQPGTYVKQAHNVGCWFRESDLEPTQISGTDLRGALGRRGRPR